MKDLGPPSGTQTTHDDTSSAGFHLGYSRFGPLGRPFGGPVNATNTR